jgi:hypothetical protein
MQLKQIVSACAVAFVFLTSARAANQTRLFSVNNGDAIIREWNSSNGAFLSNAVTLTDSLGSFSRNADIEFDGQYFYSLAPNDPRIRKFNRLGQYLEDVATLRDSLGSLSTQVGLAADGQYFYTIAPNDPRIRRFDLTGQYLADVGSLRDSLGPLSTQTGLATDGQYFYTIAAGDYRVRRFDLTGNYLDTILNFNQAGTVDGNNTGLAVYQPLSATILPTNWIVLVGSNVVVTPGIAGYGPFTFQWLLKGRKLAGQTNARLSVPNIQLRSRGAYQIEVRNNVSVARSALVSVTVLIPPTIVLQPRDLTVREGKRVTLRVTAKGSKPFAYQWFKDGIAIAQSTNKVLTFLHVASSDAGLYSVRVSNAGAFQDSIPASVVVAP